MEAPLQSLRSKWVQDGFELDDENWRDAVSSPRTVAIPANLCLVQLKILHRVYVTGSKLAHMGILGGNECRRRCGGTATFMHIIWECSKIQTYWQEIHQTLREVLETDIRLETRRCLLNIWEPTDLNSHAKSWVTLALMIAKRNIAQKWGAEQPPTLDKWKSDLDWSMFREKSVYISRGCPGKWSKMWESWNVYRGGICTPPMIETEDTESE